ncbi:hypothetical protein ACHQM5_001351 [Ranunculus cassubicifolius]
MDNEFLYTGRNDSTNPYFLHHSDHPGLVLVSKKLTGENYASWHFLMAKSLNAKNKLGFVDGTISAPSHYNSPDEYALWSRCNDMVHLWIINVVDSDIGDSAVYYATAYEIWEDQRERFSQSNAPRIFEIQRDIAYHRQDHLSAAAYYTKLKNLWDELSSYTEVCQCGAQQERQRLLQFLMGLNESYNTIRGQVLLMNPLPSVRQAYSSISQEERQRAITLSAPQGSDDLSAAMAVQNIRQNFSTCTHRGDRSDRQMGSSSRRPHCTHCDKPGHYVDTCYQLNGFPPGHPKNKSKGFKNGFNR